MADPLSWLSGLPTAQLENLVAVLASTHDRPPLLIYVDRAPDQSAALTLDELPNADLSPYDGQVIGFAAIDIIRPDLATKGARFQAIAPSLRQRLGQTSLNRVAYTLAVELLGFVDDRARAADDPLRARVLPEIISLALPGLLATRSLHGLIGLQLDSDLWRYLQDYAAQGIYLTADQRSRPDDLTLTQIETAGALTPGAWLIGLEELQLFCREVDLQAARFINLRPLLREADQAAVLRSTLFDLAQQCWRRPPVDDRRRSAAWGLMIEHWLMAEEIDDLVCFVPGQDFEKFTQLGIGARFYRKLPHEEALRAGPFRLEPLDKLFAPQRLPHTTHGTVGALAMFRPYLRQQGYTHCLDLGEVLWRMGCTATLARTLALTARDVADWPDYDWRDRGLEPEAVYQAAWRSCVLLGLEQRTPATRGFYDREIQAAYQVLSAALRALTEKSSGPRRAEYAGLAAWFDCGLLNAETPAAIEPLLRQMAHHLSIASQADGEVAPIHQLLDVANASISLLTGGGQLEFIQHFLHRIAARPDSRLDLQRAAAQAAAQPAWLSDFFLNAFQELADLAERVRAVHQKTLHEDDKIRQLRQLALQIEAARQRAYALPHELGVLRALYSQIIQQALNLAEALKGRAVLELSLSIGSVLQHTLSPVTLHLRNLGGAAAETIQVTLDNSERFNIQRMSSTVELERLLSGETRSVSLDIMPYVDDQLSLRFTATYRDQGGAHTKSQDFTIRVVSLDRGPFTRKENPYIVGNPIQNPHNFYGRRGVVLSVIDQLAAGVAQSTLLRGARRTGKTSVLFMIKAIIEDTTRARTHFTINPRWYPALDKLRAVFIDLTSLAGVGQSISMAEFYSKVSGDIARAVGLQPGVDGCQLAVDRVTFQASLESCLSMLPPGGRLVLLLDEFDVVETITAPEFYFHLRQVITYLQRITWIVTSAAGLYEAVQHYASPLFNVFRIKELGRLGEDEARQLVLEPLAGKRLQFLDEAVEAVLDQSGCYP
ncbi:MAG: ATP-binding protein, partial [Chloroflexi bacterium]|nr:ATP-binding protein [Chloroflexota bacterium]